MKKKLLVIGGGILFVMKLLTEIDGSLNFLSRLGVSEKMIAMFMETIKFISAIGTPVLLIIVVIQLLKVGKKADNVSIEFQEYKKQKETEFQTFRENVNKQLNYQLSEISRLWQERNKQQNDIVNIYETKKLAEERGFAVLHAVVGVLNSFVGTNEQDRIVEALYGRIPIPEYEKIGLHEDLIRVMQIKYHAEKLAETENLLSPLQKNKPREQANS